MLVYCWANIGDNQVGTYYYTVALIIFVCLNFCEFLIFRLFTKFRIRKFCIFFFSSTIIINDVASFLISQICPPAQ